MQSFNELFKKIPPSLFNTDQNSDIAKLYKLYVHFLDETLLVARELSNLRDIDEQTRLQNSAVLDQIGEIVKEPRLGKGDAEYNKYLKVAIARNRANGSLDSLLSVVAKLSGDTNQNNYLFRELFIATEIQKLNPMVDAQNQPTVFLDGTEYLNHSINLPAALQVSLPGVSDVDKKYIAGAFNEIKPAGVEIDYK